MTFKEFFVALNGYEPFPWQERLAKELENRRYPEVLALPPASGKTAIIDAWVWALARTSASPRPRVPRRLLYVIDRRLVVDEVSARAERIAEALETPPPGPLTRVREQLLGFGGEAALRTVKLRGGIFRDEGWLRGPHQPTILVATVDQAGSRLLFRGYGISRGQRPIHAGLLGVDTLLLLDEVHLSSPFWKTAKSIQRYAELAQRSVGPVPRIMSMSATPKGAEKPFNLDAEDRKNPVLKQRLQAVKTAKIQEVSEKNLEQEMVCSALRLAEGSQVEVVGVIVNRVKLARSVFGALREREQEAILLTGRIRPFDRDQLVARWLPAMEAGRDRSPKRKRPLFVVATQTVEVGANLDFDALVTEAAPWRALLQRFGRLNRLGELKIAMAEVLLRKESKKGDPIYGDEIGTTWKWLKKIAKKQEVEFSEEALRASMKKDPPPEGEEKEGPTLLPSHLFAFVQTRPEPVPDPTVAPFLHGPNRGPADVQMVWRADLREKEPEEWEARVALCPPRPAEALSVPYGAARSWLTKGPDAAVSDIEGPVDLAQHGRGTQPVLLWRGAENARLDQEAQVRPGDTVVLPANYGGADEWGWFPQSNRPVRDVGNECLYMHWQELRKLGQEPSWKLRVFEGMEGLEERGWSEIREVLETARSDEPKEQAQRLVELLQEEVDEEAAPWLSELLAATPASSRWVPYPRRSRSPKEGSGEAHEGILLVGRELEVGSGDVSAHTVPVELESHLHGVARWVERLVRSHGIEEHLGEDLTLAAKLHDLGKEDPRMQVWLHGGDESAAAAAKEPLAKSGMGALERRRARAVSGLPAGWRHELASLLEAEERQLLEDAHDRELVRHLVGSHHGHGRPFVPGGQGVSPIEWAEQFWRLVERYGHWGLAFLEAHVRVADYLRSAEEMEEVVRGTERERA